MENHSYTTTELLGILTSMGRNHTMIVQTASLLLLEDLTNSEFKDTKVQQECINYTEILVAEITKYHDLIETVLEKWKESDHKNE